MKHHLRSLNIAGLIVTILVIGINFVSSAALELLAPWLLVPVCCGFGYTARGYRPYYCRSYLWVAGISYRPPTFL